MSKRKKTVLTITLLGGLLVVGLGLWARVSANFTVNWDIIGGGGEPIRSASFAVNSTVGQAAIGPSGSASYLQGTGYWYVVAAPVRPPEYRNYLPSILRY